MPFHKYCLQHETITPTQKDQFNYFTITHVFHPCYGRKFKLVEYYKNWGAEKVSYFNDQDNLSYIPHQWTSLVPPEPFIVFSRGRACFDVKCLIELSKLQKTINTRNTGKQDGDVT